MQFVTCMQQVVSSVNPLANQDLSACRAMGEQLYEPLKMIYGLATKSSVRTAAWKGMKSELLKYGNILTCTGPYTDPALCNYMQGRLLGDFVADYALTAGSLKLVEGVKKVAKVTNFTTALKVINTVENGFTSINNTVGKLQNAIIQKVGTGANLTAKLIVNGSTELLSYSRKVINVPASRWITSTSGWTYISSIAGDYIDQTGKKVKGYLKIYKRNCLTGNSITTNANARVQASTTGNENECLGVSGVSPPFTLPSAKGLIGKDFEDFLAQNLPEGGPGFLKGGRDFDAEYGNPKKWVEAKSGAYWVKQTSSPEGLNKFKADMGSRLKIAKDNHVDYELFSNSVIPDNIKSWLDEKGLKYYEILE